MKQLVAAVLFVGLVGLVGCSKNSSNPLAPGGPEPPSVVFSMHLESGTQGMIFVASPSVDVRLQKIIVEYPPEKFVDTLTNPDPTVLVAKGTNIQVAEYTGVESKQRWVLTFIGSEAVTNKPFSVKLDWEVI